MAAGPDDGDDEQERQQLSSDNDKSKEEAAKALDKMTDVVCSYCGHSVPSMGRKLMLSMGMERLEQF
jgi:hypothetical protein